MTKNYAANNQDLKEAIEQKLVPLIEQAVRAEYGLAGLAIGIVKDGEILFARGFGKRNLETGEPVTAHSLFHLASVSKSFVATAIMQLWEQGRLDLDAPVTTYLPYFALKGADSQRITLRHLLSHTSGMPDIAGFGWHEPAYDDGALERFVRSLANEEMIAAPGERYSYSNPAFDVLGDVIAKVSGQEFETYIQDHILDPLGMHDSTFLRREVAPALATTPHLGAPPTVLADAYPYHRAHAPCSSLHSNAADMCRWLLANLAHGNLGGQRILRETTHETLWGPVTKTGEDAWQEWACLGWFRGTSRARQIVQHGGSDPGYFADKVLFPAEQLGVIVMANAYCATAWGVTDAAIDLMLGLEPQAPKIPISVPIGAILAAEGLEAAIAQYHQLSTQPERYDVDPDRFFHATWGAIEMHRLEAALPMVNLWITLQPNDPLAHEMLGWAQMVHGEKELAAAHLHRALALDPDAWHAKLLLQRLDREND